MQLRLIKVAKELNVGTSTIVDYLFSLGFEIENKPTARIPDEMYAELKKEFGYSRSGYSRSRETADSLIIGTKTIRLKAFADLINVAEKDIEILLSEQGHNIESGAATRITSEMLLSIRDHILLPRALELIQSVKKDNLFSIDLSNLFLNTLPNEISTLKKIKVINLSNNKFESFPDVLFQFKNLEGLNLSNNLIKEIPSNLLGLKKLNKLDISDNPIITPPQEVIDN